MTQIDISNAAIIKVTLSGIFLYVLAPILMVARDLILLKIIEEWVLTDRLKFQISICESDRWYLNEKYNKKRETGISRITGHKIHKLNGIETSEEEYNQYERGLNTHSTRFYALDSKINFFHNLIISLTKHYKTEDFESPIPLLREEAYDNAAAKNA